MASVTRGPLAVSIVALALALTGCKTQAPTTAHLLHEGERCDKDDQCETALCVALPKGDKTCRRTCAAGCIGEELCTTFGTGSNGLPRAGCVPGKAGLCTPCTVDTDCPYAADACLTIAGSAFCGRDCSYDGACPDGYACSDGTNVQGTTVAKQCIPKSATCSCVPQTKGQKRPCQIKNDNGTCTGQETCDGTAFTGCDAQVPAPEICDGKDNDCNGKTDDNVPDVTCGKGECTMVMTCKDGVMTDGNGNVGAENCKSRDDLKKPETCNGKDDNCDGQTDEGFDLKADVANCGACGNACKVAHGTPGCKDGACFVASCDVGFDDCNHDYKDGCEADLNADTANCGKCLGNCNLGFASPKCDKGICKVDKCVEGHWNVDGLDSNGCEYACTVTNNGKEICDNVDNDCNGKTDDGIDLTTDPNNCGKCGNVCVGAHGTANCVASACKFRCDPGYADCDALVPGCETNTDDSTDNCGGCGKKCQPDNATGKCVVGACTIVACATGGWEDCNSLSKDGCEINTQTDPSHCGSCLSGCAVANGKPGCDKGSCSIASCNPPYLNCDGKYLTGCNLNKDTDLANCGACNNACPTRPNSTPQCASGACVNNCAANFQDCDHDPVTGCESDKRSDPANCGACDNKCTTYANADATCVTSTCGWACKPGWADCKNGTTDGCETLLNTFPDTVTPPAPHCTQTVTDLTPTAALVGDGMSQVNLTTITGTGEAIFKFKLSETDFETACSVLTFACINLSAEVKLQSPNGTVYAAIISTSPVNTATGSCGGNPTTFDAAKVGDPVDVGLCVTDTASLGGDTDNSTEVYVEILYRSGSGCGTWTLDIAGSVALSGC